jgi:hypothetical protein
MVSPALEFIAVLRPSRSRTKWLNQLRVGLAAGLAHHLADEEAGQAVLLTRFLPAMAVSAARAGVNVGPRHLFFRKGACKHLAKKPAFA